MALDPKLKDAINYVHSHAQTLQAILTVADAVKSVEEIERLAGEEHTRLKLIRDEIPKAEAEVGAQKLALEAILNDIAQAEKKAKTVVTEARDEAKKIRAKAVDDAVADVAKATQKAQTELDKLKAETDRVDTILSEKQVKLSNLETDLIDKAAEVEALEKRVALAKAYLDRAAALE